ncbi:hypothetical protein LCGC14_0736430 [marine sediment metagenome]|uniref:Uncharacterized protein n=1 Tax=marine sediment metagenome TaxID=412755 RepID=A0A0F9Q814_9ZZZZ
MTADAIYHKLVCEACLFGVAFFGWRGTRNERRKLSRLWKRALKEAGQ